MNPPEQMRQKGEHDGHRTVVLEVRFCENPTGRVWSEHSFQTAEDETLSREMRGGGVRQVAHALLTEALRRETFVSALAKMSADPGFLSTYATADDEKQRELEQQLGGEVREVIWRTLGKMGSDAAREVLLLLASQLSGN